jgi:hypothetical protein
MLTVFLLISESSAVLTTPLPLTTSVETTPSSTATPTPPRLCGPIELEYCNNLPYNITSYPNKLGHRSIKEVRDDVITFRYFYLSRYISKSIVLHRFNYLSSL